MVKEAKCGVTKHFREKPSTTENLGEQVTNLTYLTVLYSVAPPKKKLVNPYYVELGKKKKVLEIITMEGC